MPEDAAVPDLAAAQPLPLTLSLAQNLSRHPKSVLHHHPGQKRILNESWKRCSMLQQKSSQAAADPCKSSNSHQWGHQCLECLECLPETLEAKSQTKRHLFSLGNTMRYPE